MNEKKQLIYNIKHAEINKLTLKQLKSINKIIKEYTKDTITESSNDQSLLNEIVSFRNEYEEYLKKCGYVDIGIEYQFLHKLDEIINYWFYTDSWLYFITTNFAQSNSKEENMFIKELEIFIGEKPNKKDGFFRFGKMYGWIGRLYYFNHRVCREEIEKDLKKGNWSIKKNIFFIDI